MRIPKHKYVPKHRASTSQSLDSKRALTRSSAWATGLKAADQNMQAHGRSEWSQEDYSIAMRTFGGLSEGAAIQATLKRVAPRPTPKPKMIKKAEKEKPKPKPKPTPIVKEPARRVTAVQKQRMFEDIDLSKYRKPLSKVNPPKTTPFEVLQLERHIRSELRKQGIADTGVDIQGEFLDQVDSSLSYEENRSKMDRLLTGEEQAREAMLMAGMNG